MSQRLPVIVGFGGFNAAGRSSGFHAYRRMVLESLGIEQQQETIASLATMMGQAKWQGSGFQVGEQSGLDAAAVDAALREQVLASTLVRRIESQHFDVDRVHEHRNVSLAGSDGAPISFQMSEKQLPSPVPAHWQVEPLLDGMVKVTVNDQLSVKLDSYREFPVQAAGQLPTGFDPGELYASRFHPRALQMAVTGASDCLHSVGIDWRTVVNHVRPDQVGVYAGSVLSQMDEYSNLGLTQSRLRGGRVSSKQLAMGMGTMPGDFVNAYVLGSVGVTGSAVGACATFLYALRQGVEDIQSGRRRVVMVGGSESPLCPEIIEGFDAMSALATDAKLRYIDQTEVVDHRRASRPFAKNCGFVIGEASQFIMLMDDELAMELGAQIYGAVPNVFINADGYKKSISAPGPGNYITLSKAVAAARAIVGEESVRTRSFIQAHGSSTPQNRVSESLIFDRISRAFGIEAWPVSAVKAFVGHTIGPASADQLMSSLGVYEHGILPGIKTMDEVAEDVYQERLSFSNQDRDYGAEHFEVSFLNSKGFGGNNATAAVLSAHKTKAMLAKRYSHCWSDYQARSEASKEQAAAYDVAASRGQMSTVYEFGNHIVDEDAINISDRSLSIPGFEQAVDLELENPYGDMS